MEKIIDLAKYKKHPLIKHYYDKYLDPEYPPSWMIIECLTFGTWLKAFRNLKDRNAKKEIATLLGEPFKKLESWMLSLEISVHTMKDYGIINFHTHPKAFHIKIIKFTNFISKAM